MGVLASDFFKSDLFVWFAGALLVFGGLLIIAFHQYWSSVAAVTISLFGWIPALRGVVLMAAPDLHERAAMSIGVISLVRLGRVQELGSSPDPPSPTSFICGAGRR